MPKLFQSFLAFFTDDYVTAGIVILWVAAIALLHHFIIRNAAEAILFSIGILGALAYGVFRRIR